MICVKTQREYSSWMTRIIYVGLKRMNIKPGYLNYFQIVLIVFTGLTVDGFSQDHLDYADYLMQDNDFYRAISEYKKIYFFSNDAELKNHCLLNISKAYLKSNKYKLSIRYASILLNNTEDQNLLTKANNYIGLNYYGLRVLSMAEDFFNKSFQTDDTGFSLFYSALLDLEKGRYKNARQKYTDICKQYPDSEIYETSKKLSEKVLLGKHLKTKSPFISAALSTFVPGSGQVYCGHYYDGIQAFIYVGAFAYATYIAYKYDKHVNNNYITTFASLSITALFHVGNIIGATKTADYYNMKQKEQFLDQIRKDVFSVDY